MFPVPYDDGDERRKLIQQGVQISDNTSFMGLHEICRAPDNVYAQAATLTVNTLADEQNVDGNCSLREAITNTNNDDQSGSSDCLAGSGTDTINFGVTGTITLSGTLPNISQDLIIDGPGASSLTISGNNSVRVMRVNSSVTVNLQDITISNGAVSGTAGGGIYNQGILTLSSSIVANSTDTSGGGGGIWNDGGSTLTIINSTISGNSAPYGGGIYNYGNLNISESTISGNTATEWGGGLFNRNTASLVNVTISGNQAYWGGGVLTHEGTTNYFENSTIADNQSAQGSSGAGIAGNGYSTHNLRNTILSNNLAGTDPYNCYQVNNSLGYNLSSDGSCGFTQTGDMQNTNPLLGLLQNNGGPTFTHGLLAGSPALDAADPNNYPATDQRGVVRPDGPGPDIGAFEGVEQTEPMPDLTGYWYEPMTQKCKNKKDGVVCTVKGKLVVQNIGEVSADEPLVRFYLSDDETYDAGDLLLSEKTKRGVDTGKEKKIAVKLFLPADVDPAGRYIIAHIDADNTTEESKEWNNFVAYGPMD